jgi:hypothetical protein
MAKRIEYTKGQVVGKLIYLEEAEPRIEVSSVTDKKIKVRMAKFRCDCGEVLTARVNQVVFGKIVRCNQCAKQSQARLVTKHGGMVGYKANKAYTAWKSIKRRCYSENFEDFHNYGGRGIKVDDFWRDSFENFFVWWNLQDLCNNHAASIDRINNDKGYSPINCRLATRKEQSRNKRNNVWMSNGVEILCSKDVAERLGVRTGSISKHIRNHGKTIPYRNWTFVENF